MTLPNFLVIGAHKAGTTAFYRQLEQHPGIFMSPSKEPRFFALENDPLDYRGPDDPAATCEHKTLAAYETLFEGVTHETAIGEASTLYLYHPDAAANIHRHVPTMRLIAILRQPAERAYSNFVFCRRDGQEPIDDFRAALAAEDERVAARWGPLWHYRRKGLYATQLARYTALFDPSQIRIFLYDDLRARPAEVVRQAFAFLDVSEDFQPDVSARHNVSGLPRSAWLHRVATRRHPLKSVARALVPAAARRALSAAIQGRNLRPPPPFDPDLHRELTEGYRDEIERLQPLIDRDLAHWLR